MASLAVSLAIANEKISAQVIAINEYPDLAQRYEVSGVPKTVINEKAEVVGMVPEPDLIKRISTAIL
jgi:predicted DsbA family dithiol-disulfide isomerase